MENMKDKENSTCDINKGEDCACGCKSKKCSCAKKVICLLILIIIVGAIVYAKMNCCSSCEPIIEESSVILETSNLS